MGVGRLRRSVSVLTGAGRGRLLASVAFGWFLILGMRFVVPGVLPTITEDFAISASEAGLAVTVMWFTYGAVQFPAGYYADRLGERLLLVGGLLVGGAGLLAFSFTPTFGLFVVVAGVFGLGTGLYGPPRGTVVSKTYDEHDGAAFGAMLAAGSVGAAVLPALAALLVAGVGWRFTLGVAAPAFLVAAGAIWWAVPDTRVRAEEAEGDSGVGNEEAEGDGGEGDEEESGAGGGAAAALRGAAAAVREPRIALAAVALTVMLFVFQAATAFLTTYLVEVKGLSQGVAGAMLGTVFVVGAVSQWSGGSLADRFGTPQVLTAVGAVSVLPMALLPVVDGLLALGVVSALIGVRMSVGPISNAYIIAQLPDRVQGTAWGGLRTTFFLLGSLGSTYVGVMADAALFDAAFYSLAVLTGLGAVLFWFLPERY